ncbi:acyltransferase [Sinorhizobium sp. BG8]|uniref:acyltransferase family protein n=1 Tax=Sinorhizobium sp. BG8 TaxID=2613773 RepID=UPI00193D3AC2|nr:acyltransferase [Sinorhizobium sp. BG8]
MDETRHITSLDGLRGIAASLVLVSHVHLIFPSLGPLPFTDIGSEAVAVFFALSGFLMAYLYGTRPLTRAAAQDFLVSRFARIYPVYFVAVCLGVLLSAVPGLGYIHPISGLTEIVRHVMMLGSSGVLWSVPPEIQFYLLFPVIWLVLSNPLRHQGIAIAIAAFLAVDALLGFPGPGILIPSKLPYFLLGVVAGRLHLAWREAPRPAWTGVLAIVLFAFLFTYRQLFPDAAVNPWGLPSALAAALVVSLAAREHPASAWLLSSRPLRFAGAVSFSLYLFHVPVMFLTRETFSGLLPEPLLLVLATANAFLAAWVSYHVIETPSRRMLVSLWRKRRAIRPADDRIDLSRLPADTQRIH